ncbi:hypothetical protein BD410DRAFT_434310 [Rickenella mellea]|uniref:Uncharacterized protein n=1 Tax=Rickenella mellea TaxID=50990 RepID=A0A4Y7PW48_9AGAM|nr:hypothetical protein BD410DRAFT_434310 [Rickenella mellea]
MASYKCPVSGCNKNTGDGYCTDHLTICAGSLGCFNGRDEFVPHERRLRMKDEQCQRCIAVQDDRRKALAAAAQRRNLVAATAGERRVVQEEL